MSFVSFWSDVGATVLGGGVITLLLFLAKEWIFPPPKLRGVWEVTTITKTSIREEFQGMELTYRVILLQAGTHLSGTAEKIREKTKDGSRDYRGADRIRSNLDGNIEKNYLSKSVVNVHMIEDGQQRQTTSYFSLRCSQPGVCAGSWVSTAADSSGTTAWKKIG